MVRNGLTLTLVACLVAGLGVFSGCQPTSDVGVGLVTSPDVLNFGLESNRLVLQVNKTLSSTVVEPLIARTTANWLTIENCIDVNDDCRAPFQGVSALSIPVSINRDKTRLGTNRATITLLANNAPVATVDVVVANGVVVDFDSTRQNIRAGETVQFTDLSQLAPELGEIGGWHWDFGDGNTSEETNPIHRYVQSGLFEVTLRIETSRGTAELSKPNYISVTGSETIADFEVSATRAAVNEPIQFTNRSIATADPILGFQWDFGDGNSSTQENPTHTYTRSGIFDVTLTVQTARGTNSVVKEGLIIIGQRVGPEAKIGLNSTVSTVNNPVQFLDLSDPGSSTITDWAWDFGDGNSSSERNPFHTYRRTGTFDVSLTVTTAHGSDTATLSLEVVLRPPLANFTVDNTSPSVFEFVQFTEQSVPGSFPIIAYEWDFGDGKTSMERNPRHRYTAEGTYTVSLTVRTGGEGENTTNTMTRENYIRVINPPSPDFTFSPGSAYTGSPVQFTNRTIRGSEVITSYQWDFDGDSSTTTDRSTQVSPSFTFNNPGVYTVTLTANTATRTVTICKPVVVDRAPVPNFTAAPRPGTTAQTIVFTNTTQVGTAGTADGASIEDCSGGTVTGPSLPAVEIDSYLWDFGNGETSDEENPEFRYTTPGTYTVSLTIGFSHSLTGAAIERTETKIGYMVITIPPPPVARFEVENTVGTACADPGALVRFINMSDLQGAESAEYFWDFGDGNTSTLENPANFYLAEGDYTVTLTVTTPEVFAPNNVSTATRRNIVKIGGTGNTALDAYIALADPSFNYNIESVSQVTTRNPFTQATVALNLYSIKMTSQTWRSTADYEIVGNGTATWEHNVSVLVPPTASTNTSLLFITGGSTGSSPPTFDNPDAEENVLLSFAALTGSVITLLEQVPNQRLEFADEVGDRTRTEDEIIAYTFDEYLKSADAGTPDGTWPLLLPMVKSAVRAMDVVQDLYTQNAFPGCSNCDDGRNPVQNFMVTGASKRGWTTWLTGVVDDRVKAIAPVVIDVLNMDEQMEHHFSAYGYWAPAIYPYAQERIFDRIVVNNPAAQQLLNIVDPYEYRCRLEMPKFILNSTGDQFFLPDSSQFYFDELKGEDNLLNYVPNTAHSLDGSVNLTDAESATQSLLSYYLAISRNVDLPRLSWDFLPDGSIEVEVEQGGTPRQVTLWSANNPNTRDFRLDKIGAAWGTGAATNLGGGRYRGAIAMPAEGWSGFFIQFRFPNPVFPSISQLDFIVSTPIRVLPETEENENLYPVFDGVREELVAGDASVPFVVAYGTPNEMGRQQGTLLADEIAATIPAFLAAAQAANPDLTNQALDDIWTVVAGAESGRFSQELVGMSQGAGVDLTTLRRANMVLLLSDLSGHSVAATRTRAPGFAALHSTGIEWDASLPLAPAIVLYVPTVGEGVPHANVGFAGLIGALSGVNLGGISVSAVQDPDAPSDAGTPITSGNHYTLFNRDLLYESLQLPDARTMIEDSDLIRRTHLVVADARARLRTLKARIVEANRPNDVIIWEDNAPTDEFFPNILQDGVYSISRTDDAPLIFNLIQPSAGPVTPNVLFDVRDAVNDANASENDELVFVIYESTGFPLRVTASYGGGPAVTVNLQDFLP